MNVLVAGAGLSGATLARTLADSGVHVSVIDKRNHVAGNAYDYVNEKGERIHKYGPHLFHCSKESLAVSFLSRFTEWLPYEHRVSALLKDGRYVPLPVNATTLETLFNVSFGNEEATKQFLNGLRIHDINPTNSDELFLSNVGPYVANILFRPYTQKMWGVPATKVPIGVGARLPVRTDRDDRYFTDSFQCLPKEGYTEMVLKILDHPLIETTLGICFSKELEKEYDHCFLCLPIDQYFDYCYGKLGYRSIKFHKATANEDLNTPVVNFTGTDKYTRCTQWSLLPNSGKHKERTITLEEPCSLDQNPDEYYYPIQTKEFKSLYERYNTLAKEKTNITFCGRTGLFKYLDMAPAVVLHLDVANKFLKGLP